MNEEISRIRFAEILQRFAGRAILVVGDLMVDEYLRGLARRISQEAPVMVVEITADEFKPGGAANVGNNLRALGGRVALSGVIGEDAIGGLLRTELAAWDVDVSGIVTDAARPTTRKTRIVAHNQQVLRVDREQTQPVSPEIAEQLLRYFEETLPQVDAVLISDYRKGVLTEDGARQMIALAKKAGKPLFTNPKPASARWLRGATALTLNQVEAEELAGARLPEDETTLRSYGERLQQELDVETLVITRGAKGLSYWQRSGEYRYVPAHTVEVADSAGAGDTTVSALALALLCGADAYEAAVIANRAGACVVRKSGVATVTVEELLHLEG